MRRQELVTALQLERRRWPSRIRVSGPLKLWGMDLILVWVLGFFPVWLLGVVDYHGSRVVILERVHWPSASEIVRALEVAFSRDGIPERILTDRGPVFRAEAVQQLLSAKGIRHTLTRPAHPWTNGRIERLFRLFKETVFRHLWLFASLRQVDRSCADFVLWHNRDRPHGSWQGRTPDEVYFGRPIQRRPLGRVSYFDGFLEWYRFGD